MTDYSGLGRLGLALSGADQTGGDAFHDSAKRTLSLEEAIMRAKKSRDEANFRQQAEAAIREQYKGDDATADLVVAVTLGGLGSDFHASTRGIGQIDTNRMRSDNYELAQDPGTDTDMLNRLIAATADRPLTHNNVDVENRGEAMTDAVRAQKAQRLAAAGAQTATAGLRNAQAKEVPVTAATNREATMIRANRPPGKPATLNDAVGAQPQLPPAAAAKLKPGVVTTFDNGQKWTIKNGTPTRIY